MNKTSTTQHTPGPWSIVGPEPVNDSARCGGCDYRIIAQHERGAMTVAIAFDDAPNARLIAAAPDLLTSCQELLAMVDELLPLAKQGCGWGTLATDQARAAIAKATQPIS